MKGSKRLNVFIKFDGDEILVGQLILDNRLVHFKYDEDFLALGLNLSPFKLKYNTDIQAVSYTHLTLPTKA